MHQPIPPAQADIAPPSPRIIGIASVAANGVIGKYGEIPWDLKEDLEVYNIITKGQIVVMGRTTYDALQSVPLNRDTWVLTSSQYVEGATRVIHTPTNLPDTNGREIFVCGGALTYRAFLPYMDELYITHVYREYDGQVQFVQGWPRAFTSQGVVFKKDTCRMIRYARTHPRQS